MARKLCSDLSPSALTRLQPTPLPLGLCTCCSPHLLVLLLSTRLPLHILSSLLVCHSFIVQPWSPEPPPAAGAAAVPGATVRNLTDGPLPSGAWGPREPAHRRVCTRRAQRGQQGGATPGKATDPTPSSPKWTSTTAATPLNSAVSSPMARGGAMKRLCTQVGCTAHSPLALLLHPASDKACPGL